MIEKLAANNAAWIDMAVGALGMSGEFTSVLWQNVNDMPPVFPNADTLGGTIEDQLAAIQKLVEQRPNKFVAVKDSWAKLNLTPLGFEVLFTAQWLYREAQSHTSITHGLIIEHVTTPERLTEFALACNGSEVSPDIYSPELLNRPDIAWLIGKQDGQLVAGATAVSAHNLNGINNVFGETMEHKQAMISAAIKAFPDYPACGYEAGADIELYLSLGFATVGNLQVWLKHP